MAALLAALAGCGNAQNSASASPGKLDDAIQARTEVTVLQGELAVSVLTQKSRVSGSSTSHALRKIIARAESKQEEGNILLTKDRYADATKSYQEAAKLYQQALDWDKVEIKLSKAELSAATARMLAEATAKPEELKEGEKLQINAMGYLEAAILILATPAPEEQAKA